MILALIFNNVEQTINSFINVNVIQDYNVPTSLVWKAGAFDVE